MKTRNFTTAALLLLTVGLTGKVAGHNDKDSASVLAYSETGKSHHTTASHPETTTGTENNTYVMENWIADREAWEQEGTASDAGNSTLESVHLEEWFAGRETWEQESELYHTTISEPISLMDWIEERESWEKEGTGQENPGFAGMTDNLGKWVAERENWEQK